MTNLLEQFAKVQGAKLIGINGYVATSNRITPETANYVINTNINAMNAKQKDLETLKSYPASELLKLAEKYNTTKEVAIQALSEVIASAEQNLSKDIEDRTNQSKAQTEAYTHLGKGLKFHNETGVLFVEGFVHSKKVLVEGEYKKVNSSAKTLIKNAIKKNLRMAKFRTFRIVSSEQIAVSGGTVQLK